MTEPIREQLFVAAAERLELIAAGPGYRTVPSLVTRSLLSIDQYATELAAGPVLGVMRSSGSTYELETLTTRRHALVLTVWGYVRGDDQVLAGTWLERLWDDVVTCLFADPSLKGLARDVEVSGPLETDDGGLEPLGWFAQDFVITLAESLG